MKITLTFLELSCVRLDFMAKPKEKRKGRGAWRGIVHPRGNISCFWHDRNSDWSKFSIRTFRFFIGGPYFSHENVLHHLFGLM